MHVTPILILLIWDWSWTAKKVGLCGLGWYGLLREELLALNAWGDFLCEKSFQQKNTNKQKIAPGIESQ